MAAFDGLLREALIVIAVLTLPVLGLATLIGGLVAVVQAATQIQEQTLSLLPKLLGVGLVVVLGGKFALGLCARLLLDAIAQLPAIVRG